jgi:hypothetical protein
MYKQCNNSSSNNNNKESNKKDTLFGYYNMYKQCNNSSSNNNNKESNKKDTLFCSNFKREHPQKLLTTVCTPELPKRTGEA